MRQALVVLTLLAVILASAWSVAGERQAVASRYADGRVLPDRLDAAGVAVGVGRSGGITVDVYASSAPNAYGSPSWSGYVAKATQALENGWAVNGDRETDPTAYEHSPAVVPPGEIAVTSFASWRGVVEPPAPFAGEYGNRIHFGLHAHGDGAAQFALEDLTFAFHSNDPGDTLAFTGDFIGYTYNGTTRYGINWGPDRVKGGGDDVVYSSGNGTTLVDEIVYVGVGNAWWPGGSDPNPANPDEGKQGAMDNHFAWIASDGPITVSCTYAIQSYTGSDSVLVSQETVDEIGSNGWMSDDTRGGTGTDLVGVNYTHYGKPGQTPTVADDTAIANQIQFVRGPDDVTALKLTKTSVSGGYSKSTISTVNEAGFASDDWHAGFFANYRYYATSTTEVAVLKIGIQSPLWGTSAGQSQNSFTATRSGESAWDLILVDWRGTQPPWTVNAWDRFDRDANTPCWYVYKQANNGFFDGILPQNPMRSLNELHSMNDPNNPAHVARTEGATKYTWSQVLFGTGAKVTSIQFGVGSSAQTSTSYIDYLDTSLLNNGNRVDFSGPTPVTIDVYPSLVPDEQQPRVNFGDAPTGFEPDSWQNSATGKVNWHARYLADGDYLSALFPSQAATLTINDLDSIRYWTNRPPGTAAGQDWAVYIYTRPKVGGDGSWFGYRFLNNYEEHTQTAAWTQYSTDSGMTFRKNSGTPTGLMSFGDLKTAYGNELVEMISVQTMSNWSGLFNGYMDGLTITLTDGSVGNVDFVHQPTLTLEPDDECYETGEPVIVGLWMNDVPESIVGGQYFLGYDPNILTFVSATAEAPFAELYLQQPGSGQIDYSLNAPFGDPGVSGTQKMAELRFTAARQICAESGLLAWRSHNPPTRLSTRFGQAVYPGLVAMEVIDNEAPTIGTAASNMTVECDGSGNTADLNDWLVAHGGAVATDNCSDVTWTYLPNPAVLSDDCGATGAVVVTFTATDVCSNSSDTTATFTVVDTTAPTITQQPSALQLECDGTGVASQITSWLGSNGGATASDTCSGVAWSNNFAVGNFVTTCGGAGYVDVVFTATDACSNETATNSARFTIVDTTPPEIDTCPSNIAVNADAGLCTASVTFGGAAAHDLCGGMHPTEAITYWIGTTPIASPHVFPGGVTTVTVKAKDACDNVNDTCTFTVTVSAFNEMLVNVHLSPTMVVGPITRCITFQLWNCDTDLAETVSQEITFTNGLANNVSVLVPCTKGPFTCITARDTLHTLRRTADCVDTGTYYAADFTGPDQLVGGNLNDDYWIDILDFGVFSWKWATNYGTGDTTCSTVFPHADVNGSGIVDTQDFTFIQINFLDEHEANCCGMAGLSGPEGGEGPVISITVSELQKRGLGHLAVSDLTGDGVLDEADVAAFLMGARPLPRPEAQDVDVLEPGPAPAQEAPRPSWE